MATVEDIVAAARRLRPADLLRLKRSLDRLEQQIWKKELAKTTAQMQRRNITDAMIDQKVLKRRRENRR